MKPAFVLVASMLAAQPAAAQSSDSALIRAAGALRPGTVIRVQLPGGDRPAGVLQGVGLHGLELSQPDGNRLLALQDITRLWQRKRAVPAGAIIGGVFGAGAGGFFGLIATALCEYDCGNTGTGIAIGGLIGAGVGAGIGAIIGAAIPRWSTVYRRYGGDGRERGDGGEGGRQILETGPPAPRRVIGELSLMAIAGGGGYEGNTTLAFPAQRGFLAGGEIGLAFRAGRLSLGPEASLLRGEFNTWSLGGMLRYGLGPDAGIAGRRSPHIVAGLGAVNWEADMFGETLLTGTFGAGLTLASNWRVEARWHPSFQNTGNPKPALFTIGAGYRLTW